MQVRHPTTNRALCRSTSRVKKRSGAVSQSCLGPEAEHIQCTSPLYEHLPSPSRTVGIRQGQCHATTGIMESMVKLPRRRVQSTKGDTRHPTQNVQHECEHTHECAVSRTFDTTLHAAVQDDGVGITATCLRECLEYGENKPCCRVYVSLRLP